MESLANPFAKKVFKLHLYTVSPNALRLNYYYLSALPFEVADFILMRPDQRGHDSALQSFFQREI